MATSAKFPAAILALADVFGEMPNFPEMVLSGAHNNSVTTITLTATVLATWPTVGGVTIDSERITYTGKSGATLTGCTRGAEGTTAASHADQARVGMYLTALQWNQIVADLIAVESQLGIDAPLGSRTDRWTFNWNASSIAPELTVLNGGTAPKIGAANELQMTTGATGSASVGFRLLLSSGVGTLGAGNCRRLEIVGAFANNTNQVGAIYLTDESVTTVPSATARHLGLRLSNATVYFSTGDNTTEQTTDITSFTHIAASEDRFVITYDGTTARCYVNGTLRATHATNVPSAQAVPAVMRWWIANSAAENKVVRANVFNAVMTTN